MLRRAEDDMNRERERSSERYLLSVGLQHDRPPGETLQAGEGGPGAETETNTLGADLVVFRQGSDDPHIAATNIHQGAEISLRTCFVRCRFFQ